MSVVQHQDIVGEIFTQFKVFFKGQKTKPYVAPLDVRLVIAKPPVQQIIMVQPDVVVLCDPAKIDPRGRGIKGAPDLVVEVVSPGSGYKDRVVKRKIYFEAGVREYWLVDINSQTVEIHAFEEGEHVRYGHPIINPLPSRIFPGCSIDLNDVLPPLQFDELENMWEEALDADGEQVEAPVAVPEVSSEMSEPTPELSLDGFSSDDEPEDSIGFDTPFNFDSDEPEHEHEEILQLV